jgi:hypothetical protein
MKVTYQYWQENGDKWLKDDTEVHEYQVVWVLTRDGKILWDRFSVAAPYSPLQYLAFRGDVLVNGGGVCAKETVCLGTTGFVLGEAIGYLHAAILSRYDGYTRDQERTRAVARTKKLYANVDLAKFLWREPWDAVADLTHEQASLLPILGYILLREAVALYSRDHKLFYAEATKKLRVDIDGVEKAAREKWDQLQVSSSSSESEAESEPEPAKTKKNKKRPARVKAQAKEAKQEKQQAVIPLPPPPPSPPKKRRAEKQKKQKEDEEEEDATESREDGSGPAVASSQPPPQPQPQPLAYYALFSDGPGGPWARAPPAAVADTGEDEGTDDKPVEKHIDA